MIPRKIAAASVLILLSPCEAFNARLSSQPRRQLLQALSVTENIGHDDVRRTQSNNAVENTRRSFIKQGLTATATSSTAMAFLSNLVVMTPSAAFAEDEGQDGIDTKSEEPEAISTQTIQEEKKAVEEESTAMETIIDEEQKLDSDILKEEVDEKQTISDEKKLVEDIEKEVAIEQDDTATPEDIEKEEAKVKEATDNLIKEEEKLKSETEAVISEIEKIESEVKQLPSDDGVNQQTPSDEFVKKLKEKVEFEDDLITRLKKQSEKDIDPATGKFKAMSARDYKERVKNTDIDWIKALKDTIANEEEFEKDLEAFEGLLDKEFGPAVKAARKDLAPLVDEVREEVAKDIAPKVGDVVQQLKEKAGSAVEGEVDELKHLADGAIEKLRSIF